MQMEIQAHTDVPEKGNFGPVIVTPALSWQGLGDNFDFLDEIKGWNSRGVSQ